MMENHDVLYSLLAALFVIVMFLWLWVYVPVRMAEKRGRSAVAWVFLFLLISPFWGMIALAVLGDSEKKIREDIMDEIQNDK